MANKVKITESKVSVYESPSTSSKVMMILSKGASKDTNGFKTDAKGNTWVSFSENYKIKTKDKKGKETTKTATRTGWLMLQNKSKKKEYAKILQGSTKNNITNTYLHSSDLQTELSATQTSSQGMKKTMQLFGLPYQFLPSVDYRIDTLNKDIGRKYIEKIIVQSPVVTIMPGKPVYLPGQKDKSSITNAFIQAANGNLGALQAISKDVDSSKIKFYDFKTDYIETMKYVNIMARTMATFLELQGTGDNNKFNYKINGKVANFMNYDWKDYRWEGVGYSSTATTVTKDIATAAGKKAKKAWSSLFDSLVELGGNALKLLTGNSDLKDKYVVGEKKIKESKTNKTKKGTSKTTKSSTKTVEKTQTMKDNELNVYDNSDNLTEEESGTLENLLRNIHYMQFYCDPSSTTINESIGNETKQSSLKSTFDKVSDTVKDIAFMTNSGGVNSENLQKLGDSAVKELGNALGGSIGSVNSTAGSLVSRLLGTAGNVIKGDNVIMPDIYSNSTYSKSYSISIPLRALYGNKVSIYMDKMVPLAFLLALVLPKTTSANTFGAPVLVKCFMPGKFNCNMGIVTSCSINNNEDTRNVDGLCQETVVNLDITDLYSDLSMTPSNDPVLFTQNSSLIEYLAINCGLDLVDCQFETKVKAFLNSFENFATDIPDNVVSKVGENVDNLIYSFTGL